MDITYSQGVGGVVVLFIEFSNILPKDTLGLNYATAVAQNKHVAAAAKTTKTTTKKIVTQISAFSNQKLCQIIY